MPKHTPGPWVVTERDCGDNIFTASKPHLRIANTYGGMEYEDFAANARLIAMAPTMFEFVENADCGCSSGVECWRCRIIREVENPSV